MRVGFAGTPAFAVPALAAVLGAGCEVPLVLTQPDRPSGRGLHAMPSPVKAYAGAHGLPLYQPATLKGDEALVRLRETPLDLLVVAAYGLLLPPAVLAWPRHGCINVHASILPRWRGAAPIQRALLAGDAETGVTIMQMEAGLDTGPMHAIERTAIGPRDTGGTLHDRLAGLGAGALVAVLARLARDGALVATPQPSEGATYAAKITRADTAIDWRASAAVIDRQVRAFDPVPGAATQRAGEPVKLWTATPVAIAARQGEPGEVLGVDGGALVVACGEGALRITELQPAGSRRMSAAAYVAGRRLVPGARFDPTLAPA
jgi:methionyl-tRNA formyltransferase